MKGRDVLILGAVLLVVGFALADSLRSDETRLETRPATTQPEQPTTTAPATDENLGRELFPPDSGAPGSIVLTQTGSCAVREFDLPTGIELPNVVERSTCQLWAALVTAKVAVGIAEPLGDAIPFRFIDLGRRGRDLGTSQAAFGRLIWSNDGQRAAWCNQNLEGIDQLLGGARRQLDGCPAAYTPDDEIVYARGDRLVVEDRPGLRASGNITDVHYGLDDDSVAVVVEGRRIERYVGEGLTEALDLPERFQGRLPVFSPDNCSAAFRSGDRIRILDVGCTANPIDFSFPGHVASWAPNGEWIVVGGASEVTFYNLESGSTSVWPIGAVQIVWRRT